MNLDDLKDQLREKFQVIWGKVQESSAFIEASEKFESLSPNAQKGVLAGIVTLVVLILLAIPFSMYSSSADSVADFEYKRGLIRELFRVKRESAILDSSPAAIDSGELQSRVQSQLSTAQIQPEQIRSVSEYDNSGPQSSPAIPKNVIQKGVSVSLAKLTLRQLVDLGHQLQTIHPSTKMVGLEVTASREDAHYFDVIYKIVSFSLPVEPPSKAAGRPGLKSRLKHSGD